MNVIILYFSNFSSLKSQINVGESVDERCYGTLPVIELRNLNHVSISAGSNITNSAIVSGVHGCTPQC